AHHILSLAGMNVEFQSLESGNREKLQEDISTGNHTPRVLSLYLQAKSLNMATEPKSYNNCF
ncbi:hypothetical protein M9458_040470, partial [Cirrhinus mrigala]